jgi:hypothetical integral membrane protein (TIGR02206 family)
MNQFFALQFDGGPFKLFSGTHWAALTVIIALNLLFIVWGRRIPQTARVKIRYGMAAVLLVNEMLWHVWNVSVGRWTIQEMLPLHLCSVLVWTCAYMLITKNRAIYEFAYLIGIAGALQAVLTPDLGLYDFPHFRYFQTFTSHGLLITCAIYMTVVEGFRPYARSLRNILVWGNVYLVCVTLLNFLIGSNYLYTAHKPVTASLLDVLPSWPWYIGVIELLALLFVCLFYLPFFISDLRQRRNMVW